jgi:circadian clock protein KaiC
VLVPSNDSTLGPVTTTGVPGLDYVLGGGLPTNRVFLIEGAPGTGKTTLALQFLLEGVRRKETTLYVTLAETRHELTAVAASHGWDLAGIEIFELAPPDEVLNPDAKYTVFHPSDVEMNQSVQGIYDAVERLRPARVVVDSLSEMRILAQDPLRLRRQVLALKHFFTGRGATVVLLDDVRSQESELHFASIVHWSSSRSSTAPSAGGCGSPSCAGSATAAGCTTSPSRPAAWSCSPGSSPTCTPRPR